MRIISSILCLLLAIIGLKYIVTGNEAGMPVLIVGVFSFLIVAPKRKTINDNLK